VLVKYDRDYGHPQPSLSIESFGAYGVIIRKSAASAGFIAESLASMSPLLREDRHAFEDVHLCALPLGMGPLDAQRGVEDLRRHGLREGSDFVITQAGETVNGMPAWLAEDHGAYTYVPAAPSDAPN
jgi:hypothetical protein